jgi:hypothetical protein
MRPHRTLGDRPQSSRKAAMLTREDYKERSDQYARLAIESAAPTVAEALMALALDYAKRAAKANPGLTRTQQPHASDGFGD